MLHIKAILATLLLTSTAFALPEPEAVAEARAVENVVRDASANAEAAAEPVSLDKRACKCNKVKNAGLYCGYCYLSNIDNWAVINGKDQNVYWCNKQGGCEDFGKRNSCAAYNGPCDGRDSG
ncbi:hypothetical protein PtrSN002B_000112 [Pyrenophora tritici-repentis]|uniref:Uncharacterized protein n=2 Tax=Pyrenophora tritici-repentis TaxID=45151 RepID=A0A2W1GMR2_9PLEO|nr:uncharacterized protein PTRG_07059 [Pyrenophora tritici-repentis Pt-1C-BFP]KAA8614614.1 hypothetical protein PtrV1_11644 [Pyrenophora tritici-repentis]EDU49978.1 predicted protein [Pyrenophora tritici-repentis Pt-1C-BFP]KAF7444447.1 hypothetical protein A1F99_110000 [Pyrenophora tritici-repentis]KAF7564901.1 hypothetical protein PtrM4_043350 [Pyrenophora tritici-repentis]KAG9378687.1 hypothetical protein A1F94_010456 [Pyrenophora tritici-repentis]